MILTLKFFIHRSEVRRKSRAGIHFKNVRRSKPGYGENNLLAFHLCHRHREHSVCVRRGKGHDLTTKFKRIQFGLEIYLIPNLHIREKSSDQVLSLQRPTVFCNKTRQLSLDFEQGIVTSCLCRCHR